MLHSCDGEPLFEALSDKQQACDEQQHAERDRGAERPVIRGSKKADDYIGYHYAARSADEKRREEIAEREYKSESRAGDYTRQRQRKYDATKCCPGRCAEVVRGFDKITRHMFERCVDGEKCERRVDVRQSEDNSERTIEQKFDRMI